MLPALIISIVAYFNTDPKYDAYTLPYYMWYPFDVKNPFGYLIAFVQQCATFYYNNCLCTVVICMIVKTTLSLIAMAKDVQLNFEAVKLVQENQQEMLKQFSQCIQLLSNAKQLSEWKFPNNTEIF